MCGTERRERTTCLIQISRRFACSELKSAFGLLQVFLQQLLSEKALVARQEPAPVRLGYKYGLSMKQGAITEPRARGLEFIDPACS